MGRGNYRQDTNTPPRRTLRPRPRTPTGAMPRERADSALSRSVGAATAPPQRVSRHCDTPVLVAVIAPHPTVRRRLRSATDGAEGIQLAGTFASVEAAESDLARLKVQAALLGEDGSIFSRACLRKLKFLAPAVSLIMHSPRSNGALILSSLTAGALGYVLQTAPLDQLTQAITEGAHGRVFLCKQAQWEALEHLRTIGGQPSRRMLTERQTQICLWLCCCREKEIARGLNLSVKTVHTHAEAIYKKLGVHGRQGLHEALGATR